MWNRNLVLRLLILADSLTVLQDCHAKLMEHSTSLESSFKDH